MSLFRAFFRDHRALAMLVMAVALLVKALVPQGYMVGSAQKLLSVQLCFDGVHSKTVQIAVAGQPILQDEDRGQAPQGKASEHCAFTSLGMGSLGGADAPLLALALAFILALGFAPVHPVLRGRISHLRPPLRGPPAAA